MTTEDFATYSDEQIVQYFRAAAIDREKTGFDARKGNRIAAERLAPAYGALRARGEEAVRKLLTRTPACGWRWPCMRTTLNRLLVALRCRV